jgi:hypothetical protein
MINIIIILRNRQFEVIVMKLRLKNLVLKVRVGW